MSWLIQQFNIVIKKFFIGRETLSIFLICTPQPVVQQPSWSQGGCFISGIASKCGNTTDDRALFLCVYFYYSGNLSQNRPTMLPLISQWPEFHYPITKPTTGKEDEMTMTGQEEK